MINFDDVIKENIKEHNPIWPEIHNNLYRILIAGGSGSKKPIALFNPINHEPDIDKIHLHAKDPYEVQYQFLIKKREDVERKNLNDSKSFTEMICKMFIKILKNTIQERNTKY